MKIIIMLLCLFSFNAFACIGEVTYIDFHKAKNKIEVSGDKLVIRNITPLKFVTKLDIEIRPKEAESFGSPGGLFLYDVNSKNMNEVSGEVIATEISNQKNVITIMITINAPQKGSCSKAELKYF